MLLQRVIGKILGREARKTCDDPDQQWFQVDWSLTHRAERDHHDLPQEKEKQNKSHRPDLRQEDQIEIFSGLRERYRYARVSHFLLGRLHLACGVVQAHSEDWVLRIGPECSLEQVEAH